MSETVRILVVDDDPAVCRTVVRMLKTNGWKIDTAASAEDAVPLVANDVFDLYVLDKNLPGMGGIDLAAAIRAADRVAGILILTGYASRESALEALHVGVDGYVEKPVMRPDLDKQVQASLAAVKRRRSMSDRLRSARAAAQNAFSSLDRPSPGRVLAAYSDPDYCARMAHALGAAGHQAERVNARDALELRLKEDPPDVLLAEASLAVEVTAALNRAVDRRPQLVIIVTGTPPSVRQVQALIAAGVRAVVDKPLVGDQINPDLARLLSGSL
jgi:DNA-binding response OmpR family regulator